MIKSKILFLTSLLFIKDSLATPYNDYMFKKEIREGLDIYGTYNSDNSEENYIYGKEDNLSVFDKKEKVLIKEEIPEGDLGMEVYTEKNKIDTFSMYIPTSMYIKGGIGTDLKIITDKSIYFDDIENNEFYYSLQPLIGLGINLSSFVRTEFNLSSNRTYFKNYLYAYSHNIEADLQFDLVKRYIRTGDVIRRRHFIPFIGGGINIGAYAFEQKELYGHFISPEIIGGFNIVLTNLVSIDITYKHQFYLTLNTKKIINNGNLSLSLRMSF